MTPRNVRIWVFASAALMAVGAFGPWVKVLGISVNGTDGSNDGWLVVISAAAGAAFFALARNRRSAALWPLLGGAAGLFVTIHDRHNVDRRIQGAGVFGSAASVGWGLNLALIASASFAIAGVLYFQRAPSVAAQTTTPIESATTVEPGESPESMV